MPGELLRFKGFGERVSVIPPVVIVTVAGGLLLEKGSFTINCATYVPAKSATKVGDTVVGPKSTAALPAGMLNSDQE